MRRGRPLRGVQEVRRGPVRRRRAPRGPVTDRPAPGLAGMSIPASIRLVRRRSRRACARVLRRSARGRLQRHPQALARAEPHRRAARRRDRHHAAPRRPRRRVRTADHEIPPGVWPDMREQGYARDDFPAIYQELVGPGGHHRPGRADLARRPELADAQDRRAPVRVLRRRQRARPVVVLRQGRRRAHDRQRGRRQARLRPDPLRAAAHRPDDPAAVGRLLGGRGRSRPVLPRRGRRRRRATRGRRATPSS